jgi:hypothetical protein
MDNLNESLGEEKPMRTHEFDSLDEGRKYAQKTITEDEERGLDYGYFIVDSEDSDTFYNIWEE